MPTYSKAELDEFGEWLNQFRVEKVVTDKKGVTKTINPIDMQEAMVAFGAMSKKTQKVQDKEVTVYSVILKMQGDREGRKGYERPAMIELFEHKYDAWAKRQYTEQKQIENYEEIAEQNADIISKTVDF